MLQGLLQRLLAPPAQHRIFFVAVCLAAAVALVSAADLSADLDLSLCPSDLISRQLQVAYRCQPDEFVEATTCGQAKKVIECGKGRYLAVHSASRGRSQSSTECSRMEIANDTDCRIHCVVRQVAALCQGKHRCSVSANSDRFGQACPLDVAAQSKPLILRIRYICVRKVVLEKLKHDNGTSSRMSGQKDDPCPEDGFNGPPTNYRRRGPVTPIPTSSSSLYVSSVSIAQESKQLNSWNAIKTSEGSVAASSTTPKSPIEADTAAPAIHATDSLDDVHGDSVSTTMRPRGNAPDSPSTLLRSISEWLWTWKFVCDNAEKSVLYLLCSVCFGIILLLLAVIVNLACTRRRRRPRRSIKCTDDGPAVGLAESVDSVKWRSPESESSTGDDKTFQGDEEIEATHGAHNHLLHHHHNHHPRQGYSWQHGASGPTAPPAAVETESTVASNGTEGTALMNSYTKSRRVSDGEIISVIGQHGTQSLPRRPAPHLWYNTDASDESPVAESAQTLQPSGHYGR